MQIAIGSDHAGYKLKEDLIDILKKFGHQVSDLGCHSDVSCDYPDYGHQVAKIIQNGKADFGVLVCSSGIGMSISANRHKGVRAALCHSVAEAELTRLHNNANILVVGARDMDKSLVSEILEHFLSTPFSCEERHQRRIDKIEL